MGVIYANMSMSLDGFIAGPNVSVANGMGDGGEQLHDLTFAGKSGEEAEAWQRTSITTSASLRSF